MRRALLLGVILALCLPGSAIAWVLAASPAKPAITLTVTPDAPVITPRVSLMAPGRTILFTNTTAQDLLLQTTPHSPAQAHVTVPAGGTARLTLSTQGLYHFYDAATAHVVDFAAQTDVVRPLPGAPDAYVPIEGWVDVASSAPASEFIDVPANNDLMSPRVGVVRVGGSVTIHNHDSDPHNLVTDPADPTGAAFELLGTDGEPAIHGAERRITFSAPGLYHVYCSIHAKQVQTVGGWVVVTPRDKNATGFPEGNPMEAWFLVVQE